MQELIQAKKPQTSNFENENEKGASMQPPVFQLKASETAKLQQPADEEAATAAPEGYVENVANLAILTRKLKYGVENQDYDRILNALEGLKHDEVEVIHFQKYFLENNGQSVHEYVSSTWSEEAAVSVDSLLGIRKGDLPEADIVGELRSAIEAKDAVSAFRVLYCITDHAATSKLYAQKFPGSDLYTDVVALSNDAFDVTDMANKVFGKVKNNEMVRVKNEVEAQEAREIIARIYVKYGIEFNSQKAYKDALEDYPKAPKEMKDKIKISVWTMSELRDLEKTMEKYAPFLGEGRKKTDRAGISQEVTSIGKLNEHLTHNSKTNGIYVSPNTGGCYDSSRSAVTIFDNIANEDFEQKYDTNGKNTASTQANVMTHEFSHALLKHLLPAFIKATNGYWKSIDKPNPTVKVNSDIYGKGEELTKSLMPKAEAPPMEYGAWNADEDMAVTAALFFNNPTLLASGSALWNSLPPDRKVTGVSGNPCPLRMKFMKAHLSYFKQPQK